MPDRKSTKPRSRSAKLGLLLSLSVLSMTLSGCLGTGKRVEFLMPKFKETELVCKEAPKGQLPPTTTNQQAAERIVAIDEAGEDCRQRLERVKTKIEVYREVSEELGSRKK